MSIFYSFFYHMRLSVSALRMARFTAFPLISKIFLSAIAPPAPAETLALLQQGQRKSFPCYHVGNSRCLAELADCDVPHSDMSPVSPRLRARGALVGTAETLCRKYDNSRSISRMERKIKCQRRILFLKRGIIL